MEPQSVFQNVPDGLDPVSRAPVVDLAKISLHVERGEGIPEIAPHPGIVFALAHPDERQGIDQRIALFPLKELGQGLRPGNGVGQITIDAVVQESRLIGKNSGDRAAEVFGESPVILRMGDGDEFIHGGRIHQVRAARRIVYPGCTGPGARRAIPLHKEHQPPIAIRDFPFQASIAHLRSEISER